MAREIVFFGDSNTNGYPRAVFGVDGSPTYAEIVAMQLELKHSVIARCGCTYAGAEVFNNTSA